nr:unnamed protein product [Naegleria fowleri]
MKNYFRYPSTRRKEYPPTITTARSAYCNGKILCTIVIITLLVFGILKDVQGLSLLGHQDGPPPGSYWKYSQPRAITTLVNTDKPRTVLKSSVQYQPMYTGMKVTLVGSQNKYFYIRVNDTDKSDQHLVFGASVVSSTRPDNRFSLSIDADPCVIGSFSYPIDVDLDGDYHLSVIFQNCKNYDYPYLYVTVSSNFQPQDKGVVEFEFAQERYSDNTIIITVPSFLIPLTGISLAGIALIYVFIKKKMRQTINKIVDESNIKKEEEKKKHERDVIANENSHKKPSHIIPQPQLPSTIPHQVIEVNQKGTAPQAREVTTTYSNEGIVNYVQPPVYQQQQVIDQPPLPYPVQNDAYVPQPIFNPIGMQGMQVDYPPPPAYPNTTHQAGIITSTTTTTVLVGPPIGDNNFANTKPHEP